MNRRWLVGICAVLLGGVLVANDVEARRLGGGRPTGVQRNITNAPPAQKAAPAQQQQQAAAAQQQAGKSKWGPILGGLALGGILGYLFGGSGLMGILLLAALAIGAVALVSALMRRRGREAPQPMEFAGLGRETVAPPPPSQLSALQSQAATRLPAGFDAAGFLKAAKLNFVRLQVANDRGQLDEIRELATGEMFEELKRDVVERGGATQHTDVVSLNADLIEIATEGDKHWASVRFSGMVRETPASASEGFEEVWNLVKPVDGSSGWLLAGIQQMH